MSLLKNFTFTILILAIVTLIFFNQILIEMQVTNPNNLIILALSYLWGTRDLQNFGYESFSFGNLSQSNLSIINEG